MSILYRNTHYTKNKQRYEVSDRYGHYMRIDQNKSPIPKNILPISRYIRTGITQNKF
jgi:hypothetical protein